MKRERIRGLTTPQLNALIHAAEHVLAGEAGDVEASDFPILRRASEAMKHEVLEREPVVPLSPEVKAAVVGAIVAGEHDDDGGDGR